MDPKCHKINLSTHCAATRKNWTPITVHQKRSAHWDFDPLRWPQSNHLPALWRESPKERRWPITSATASVYNDVELQTWPRPTARPLCQFPRVSLFVQKDIKIYTDWTLIFLSCVRLRTSPSYEVLRTARTYYKCILDDVKLQKATAQTRVIPRQTKTSINSRICRVSRMTIHSSLKCQRTSVQNDDNYYLMPHRTNVQNYNTLDLPKWTKTRSSARSWNFFYYPERH